MRRIAHQPTMHLQATTATTSFATGRIGGNGRNVFNATDAQTGTRQRTQRTLSARTRCFGASASSGADFDMNSRNAEFFAAGSNVLGSEHGSVWRTFVAIGLYLHATSHADKSFASRNISNVDECVVVRSKNVRNPKDELAWTGDGGVQSNRAGFF